MTVSWSGQRPSGAPPYTSYALVRVAHLLEQRMDRLPSDLGVSATGFGVLLQLSNDPGVSSAELARRVVVTSQSEGPLLVRLDAAARSTGNHRPPRHWPLVPGEGWLARQLGWPADSERDHAAPPSRLSHR